MLDSAVGKVDGVRASNNTVAVIVLLLLESSATVVISHGVGVLVRRGLGQIVSNIAGLHGGVVGGGGISWGVDSVVGNGVNSVVGNWMDSMVGNGVDSMVGNGVDSVVGNGVDGVVGDWVDGVVTNNSVVTNDMIGTMQPVGC